MNKTTGRRPDRRSTPCVIAATTVLFLALVLPFKLPDLIAYGLLVAAGLAAVAYLVGYWLPVIPPQNRGDDR